SRDYRSLTDFWGANLITQQEFAALTANIDEEQMEMVLERMDQVVLGGDERVALAGLPQTRVSKDLYDLDPDHFGGEGANLFDLVAEAVSRLRPEAEFLLQLKGSATYAHNYDDLCLDRIDDFDMHLFIEMPVEEHIEFGDILNEQFRIVAEEAGLTLVPDEKGGYAIAEENGRTHHVDIAVVPRTRGLFNAYPPGTIRHPHFRYDPVTVYFGTPRLLRRFQGHVERTYLQPGVLGDHLYNSYTAVCYNIESENRINSAKSLKWMGQLAQWIGMGRLKQVLLDTYKRHVDVGLSTPYVPQEPSARAYVSGLMAERLSPDRLGEANIKRRMAIEYYKTDMLVEEVRGGIASGSAQNNTSELSLIFMRAYDNGEHNFRAALEVAFTELYNRMGERGAVLGAIFEGSVREFKTRLIERSGPLSNEGEEKIDVIVAAAEARSTHRILSDGDDAYFAAPILAADPRIIPQEKQLKIIDLSCFVDESGNIRSLGFEQVRDMLKTAMKGKVQFVIVNRDRSLVDAGEIVERALGMTAQTSFITFVDLSDREMVGDVASYVMRRANGQILLDEDQFKPDDVAIVYLAENEPSFAMGEREEEIVYIPIEVEEGAIVSAPAIFLIALLEDPEHAIALFEDKVLRDTIFDDLGIDPQILPLIEKLRSGGFNAVANIRPPRSYLNRLDHLRHSRRAQATAA
ncbi:MAG: hypothetical protein HQ593_07265, partial [Candidatus Omnitrophica bacterium]|nr:hypothetical protein [Candidatus Omnitrophota bacterium]